MTEKTSEEDKKDETHIVICENWTETERGWGQRPDGFTLHLTEDDYVNYVKEYNEKFNNKKSVPDCYTRADGYPYPIRVNHVTYLKIMQSKNGIWGEGRSGPPKWQG